MSDAIASYDMLIEVFSTEQQEEARSFSCEQDAEQLFDSDDDLEQDEEENACCRETKEVISDGTRVPLTILYSRTARQKGQSRSFGRIWSIWRSFR